MRKTNERDAIFDNSRDDEQKLRKNYGSQDDLKKLFNLQQGVVIPPAFYLVYGSGNPN